jgi:hypothetical protein
MEINLLKQTKKKIANITENNNLLLCNTFIHSLLQNKVNLNNVSHSAWHDNLSHINGNLKLILEQKALTKKILQESSILETVEYSLPIFKKENNFNKNKIYSSKHGIFLKKITNNFFLLLNPWNSIIIESSHTYSLKKLNDEIHSSISLISEPKIRSFFNSNIQLGNNINLNEIPWLMPIKSYGVIYLSKNKNLEYSSLLNEDNQPICRNLSEFSRKSDECKITSKINNNINQKFNCKNHFSSKFERIEALLKWN